MLHITWTIVLAATAACLSVVDRLGDELGLLVPRAPKVIELRKRYTIYVPVYYVPDWTAVTTCGIIPYALASQNGLYGTDAATDSTPYSVTCDCLCAHAGNYLGCVDVSTGSVATTCTDYTTSPDYCDSDQPCYWDLHCKSASPFCNQNIYSGSITQWTCGSVKHAPITISEPISMTPYSAVPPNTTTTSSSTTSSSGSSSDSESSSIAEVLQKVGLSVGALAGICAGALALCCASCCGFFWWRSRRGTKKYASSPYMYQNVQYQPPSHSQQPSQQPLMGQNQHFQQQYPQHQYYRQ